MEIFAFCFVPWSCQRLQRVVPRALIATVDVYGWQYFVAVPTCNKRWFPLLIEIVSFRWHCMIFCALVSNP